MDILNSVTQKAAHDISSSLASAQRKRNRVFSDMIFRSVQFFRAFFPFEMLSTTTVKVSSSILVLLLLGLPLPCYTVQSAAASLENAVKGAYLFKFGDYVEWPANTFTTPTAPLVIGVAGDDALGTVMEEMIKDRKINGHPVKIQRFQRGERPQNANILFIGQSELNVLESWEDDLHGVLTVGESEAGSAPVMINFVVRDNKVHFEVNLDQVNKAGLKLSSKLLSVALVVKGKPQ